MAAATLRYRDIENLRSYLGTCLGSLAEIHLDRAKEMLWRAAPHAKGVIDAAFTSQLLQQCGFRRASTATGIVYRKESQ